MKQYYISNSGKEEGPFSLKELKNQKITNDTLVWYEGLEDWKAASELEDLNDLLKPKPKAEEPNTKPVTRKKTIPKTKKTVTRTNVPKASPRMFSNVFGLSGRIRRLEYGLSYLAYYFIYFIYIQNIESTFLALVFLLSTYVIIVQGAKRCHDRGNSGWFQLIPFYFLWLLFGDGQEGTNEYGPNPKG